MDYEKKYKDALKRAKELSKRQSDITTMEYIFQELAGSDDKFEKPNGGIVLEDCSEGDGFYKVNLAYLSKEQVEEIENIVKKRNPERENEDEKIKKGIKSVLEHYKESEEIVCPYPFVSIDEALAWLEKQGGNLVENGHTNNKDFIKYADNYSREIWHKLMDNFKNIKDYHIGCNEVSDIVLNAIIDTCNWLKKQDEHTIACSEEQMKVLDEILTYAANHEDSYWNDYILGTLNGLIKQLKRLKV